MDYAIKSFKWIQVNRNRVFIRVNISEKFFVYICYCVSAVECDHAVMLETRIDYMLLAEYN